MPGSRPLRHLVRPLQRRRAAAGQQDLERRRQEEADLRQHISNVVCQADKAKREAAGELRGARSQPPPITDSTIFMAFERLRQRAEKEAAFQEGAERRPSWAPPLLLGEDLAAACLELEYIGMDDKWIARIWATFAAPKRSGRWLREHKSNLPLAGLAIDGYLDEPPSADAELRKLMRTTPPWQG